VARFFAVLSGSVPTELIEDYFEQRTIEDGISKREGLIVSRSILSTEVYQTLDLINKDGTKGTVIPQDRLSAPQSPVFTGQVYTSTIPGVVIPEDNTYRTRPTESIVSTTPNITATGDFIFASYNNYLNAGIALETVLNSIDGGGPTAREGNDRLRTRASIWHNEQLEYFAWDDYTPGLPTSTAATATAFGCGNSTTITGSINISWDSTYSNDENPEGSTTVKVYADENVVSTVNNPGNIKSVNVPVEFDAPIFPVERKITTASVQFFDATVKTSSGSEARLNPNVTIPETIDYNCQGTTITVEDIDNGPIPNECSGGTGELGLTRFSLNVSNGPTPVYVGLEYRYAGIFGQFNFTIEITVPPFYLAGQVLSYPYVRNQFLDFGSGGCSEEIQEFIGIAYPTSVNIV
jgi:hypothetical protein